MNRLRRTSLIPALPLAAVATAVAALGTSMAAGATPARATGTTVALRHSAHGKVLVGASKKFVYVHVSGTHDVGCALLCQEIWPMVKTTGAPRAGKGVTASKLGQTASHQVTYNGHKLYYFSPAPQGTTGDDANSFGGEWRLVMASGKLH